MSSAADSLWLLLFRTPARLVSTCPHCLARLSLQPDLAQPNTPAVLADEPCLEPCEPPTGYSPQRGKAPVIRPMERHKGLFPMTHGNGSLMSPCRSLEPSYRTRHRRSTGTLIFNPDEHHRTNPRPHVSARKDSQLIHTGQPVLCLQTNKGRCTIRREIMSSKRDKLVSHANPVPSSPADPLTPANRTIKQPGTPAATTIAFPRLACPVTALILLTDTHILQYIQQAFCQAHGHWLSLRRCWVGSYHTYLPQSLPCQLDPMLAG
jgi:hypothetical protein